MPILGPDSTAKSRDIWCAKEPMRAWRDWMLDGVVPPKAGAKCDTAAIERNLAFSRAQPHQRHAGGLLRGRHAQAGSDPGRRGRAAAGGRQRQEIAGPLRPRAGRGHGAPADHAAAVAHAGGAGRGRDAGAPLAGGAVMPDRLGEGAADTRAAAHRGGLRARTRPRGAAGRCARGGAAAGREPAAAGAGIIGAASRGARTAPAAACARSCRHRRPSPSCRTAALDAAAEPGGARTEPAPPSAIAAAEAGSAPSLPASSGEPAPVAADFEWPPSTRLSYRLTGNYRGPVEGQAQVEWLRAGTRYQVHMELSIGPDFSPADEPARVQRRRDHARGPATAPLRRGDPRRAARARAGWSSSSTPTACACPTAASCRGRPACRTAPASSCS